MWYDDLDGDVADMIAECKQDAYWEKLERYWYKMRPHTIDRDFEELTSRELDQLKRDFESYMENEDATLNPERFYMTGGR